MIRLPAALERKLAVIFPRVREREHFVTQLVTEAIEKSMPKVDDQPKMIGGTLHLFTDGGSRGNPGQAAIGCVLIDPSKGEILKEHGEAIGVATNNIAEYMALIAGLKLTKQFLPRRLICHMDSELVVKQLSGEYRVKMATFQPLIDEITKLKGDFPDVQFKYIARSDNFRADGLVNRALDAARR